MARRATIDDQALLEKLSTVFRDVGYEGASLAALSEASGLKKASLYHRFPDGKEQMAREVLAAAGAWLEEHVLGPLAGDGPPEARVDALIRHLNSFYSGGKQACLLNMLSSAHMQKGPFSKEIKQAFDAWIGALAAVLKDAGFDPETAQRLAERAVVLLQGSLVLARGTGSTKPFRAFLKHLPEELFGTDAVSR